MKLRPYRVTPDELRAIAVHLISQRLLIYVCVIWGIAAWLFFAEPYDGSGEMAIVISFSAVLGACLAIGLSLWKNTRPRVLKLFDRLHSIELDGDWMEVQIDDGSHSRTQLSDYHHARTVAGFFIIYTGAQAYFPVPMTAFESEADREAFESRLRAARLLR